MSTAKAAQERRWLVEAVAWHTHLAEIDALSSEDFEVWLAADPGHTRAWQQVQRSCEFIAEHADSPRARELRSAALRNVRDAKRERESRSEPWRWRRAAMAAAVVMTVGTGVLTWQLTAPDVYETTFGEIRVVSLQDGSRVALDSNSQLRVDYSTRARDLQLGRGQARFEVAHDVERPFSVTVNGQKIVATGTEFNIDMLNATVFVTLISGSVEFVPKARTSGDAAIAGGMTERIDAPPGNASPQGVIRIQAGEQLIVSPATPPYLINVDVDRTTAWQSGRLVFANESLASVVERVSRYADRPVQVEDEAIGALRISGVFKTGDIDGFVETISNYVGVRAERGRKGEIVLRHRG